MTEVSILELISDICTTKKMYFFFLSNIYPYESIEKKYNHIKD